MADLNLSFETIGFFGDPVNEKIMQQIGQEGKFVLSEEARKQMSKLQNQKRNHFQPPVKTSRRVARQPYRFLHETDMNSEESRRLLEELKPVSLTDRPKPSRPVGAVHSNDRKSRKNTYTRTAPGTGFKSLYQLSLMLGKGFNIDDLYLVQDSFSKESIGKQRNTGFSILPFNTINPPVTVVPLRPQSPSTRFEPLNPNEYLTTVNAVCKHPARTINLQDDLFSSQMMISRKKSMRDLVREMDLELTQLEAQEDFRFDRKQGSSIFAEPLDAARSARSVKSDRFDNSESNSVKSPHESGDLELKSCPHMKYKSSSKVSLKPSTSNHSIKPNSSQRTVWMGSSASNSISSLSKSGLLRKDIYDVSDEESTPNTSEDEDEASNNEEEITDEEASRKSEASSTARSRKPDSKTCFNDNIVMYNYQHKGGFMDRPSTSSELPSSRESTKANASLTSRVGLDDFESMDRCDPSEPGMQSSERAHPLCNTVTAGTVMKTYEKAIGKDNQKAAQRSHTFSGLESKPKRGKERLALSFPTIHQHH